LLVDELLKTAKRAKLACAVCGTALRRRSLRLHPKVQVISGHCACTDLWFVCGPACAAALEAKP
jgi:hypothetical protein